MDTKRGDQKKEKKTPIMLKLFRFASRKGNYIDVLIFSTLMGWDMGRASSTWKWVPSVQCTDNTKVK